MNFKDINELKIEGFFGFEKIGDLFNSKDIIPKEPGVYLVLYTFQTTPVFTEVGSGGFFKDKNPNVPVEYLIENWVENTIVIYIGKAGGFNSDATLKSRLIQYLKFGQGKDIGHYGGRLIWQIKNYKDLLICWKPITQEEPAFIESELIKEFTSFYGKRPFANLTN